MSGEVWFCPEGHEHPNREDAIAEGCDEPDDTLEPWVDWWEG